MKRLKWSAALAVTTALVWPTCAQEAVQQSAPANADLADEVHTYNTVMVTARRREESLQEVPVSVTAFSTEDLLDKRVLEPFDLNYAVPGLTVSGSNGGSRHLVLHTIRGQGQCTACANPGVVTYFSDVPEFQTTSYFDMESVQVLKGPQGTLFGRNTTGGAILLAPRKPEDEFGGNVRVQLGNYNFRQIDGTLTGPLGSDKLLGRIAVQSRYRDGFTYNTQNGTDLDDLNRINARASLSFLPTDDFRNDLVVFSENVDENGAGQSIQGVVLSTTNAALFDQLQAEVIAQQARGPRQTRVNRLEARRETFGVVNTTRWDVNDTVYLKNIFGYKEQEVHTLSEFDGTYLPLTNTYRIPGVTGKSDALSEEFQIGFESGPLNGIVGGYYGESASDPDGLVPGRFFPIPYAALPPSQQALALPFQEGSILIFNFLLSENSQSTEALFGHLEYELTDKLTLSGGLRRTWDEMETRPYIFASLDATTLSPSGPARSGEWAGTTYDGTLQYQVTPDVMTYFAYKKGYRGGGLNNAPADRQDLATYAPEDVQEYEIGLKSNWHFAGTNGLFNLAIFQDNYENIQRAVLYPTEPPRVLVQNAAEARIQGADVEFMVQPSDWFELSIDYSYLDADYLSWPDLDPATLTPIDRSDEIMANSPKHKITVSPRLTFDLSQDRGELSFFAQVSHQTEVAVNDINTPTSIIDPYTLFNARVDWRNMFGSNVNLGIFGQNLTNELYPISIGDATAGNSTGFITFLYSEPRMYGVELSIDF